MTGYSKRTKVLSGLLAAFTLAAMTGCGSKLQGLAVCNDTGKEIKTQDGQKLMGAFVVKGGLLDPTGLVAGPEFKTEGQIANGEYRVTHVVAGPSPLIQLTNVLGTTGDIAVRGVAAGAAVEAAHAATTAANAAKTYSRAAATGQLGTTITNTATGGTGGSATATGGSATAASSSSSTATAAAAAAASASQTQGQNQGQGQTQGQNQGQGQIQGQGQGQGGQHGGGCNNCYDKYDGSTDLGPVGALTPKSKSLLSFVAPAQYVAQFG